ncbi:class I SAM-dependent methyltransferase [Streptomyces purpurogeneiscleroticus]|uniref:class I SAM-dependent methyltransferase n=1 Tax=Streptomyces purpurogeneiscleroticus TaxID=68259 RepID=UPI001CBF8C29|nr:class I SAM-dependent methyltransferase [Streptomyces purpurogeneiscleroticus]MBZ4016540.1 SAM-dependent methyltransferase [Streptomyces purpurogeneiscleroticus]
MAPHAHQHQNQHQNQHHHASGHEGPHDEPFVAELLDLEAEVLHAHLTEVTGRLADLTADRPVRRILDLGSGTGTGTFALLRRFEDAEAIAVDASPRLLHHLRGRARELGVADRVRTVEADLDAAWPDFGNIDLVWASGALHHMSDPDRTLREAYAALAPGGLLAVIEMAGVPYFLPHDLGVGRPGLEARCRAALSDRHAEAMPHRGADWGPLLSRAGFTVEAEWPYAVELVPPLPEATGRYARAVLSRMRTALDGRADTDDLATLDTLIDSDGPHSVLHRDDLAVRTERTVWAARRAYWSTGSQA